MAAIELLPNFERIASLELANHQLSEALSRESQLIEELVKRIFEIEHYESFASLLDSALSYGYSVHFGQRGPSQYECTVVIPNSPVVFVGVGPTTIEAFNRVMLDIAAAVN